MIPSSCEIDAVEETIAIDVRGIGSKARTVVKPRLCSEYTADVEFPRELDQSVYPKGLVQSQIGWSPVKVGAVIGNAGFRYGIPVAGYERTIRISLACIWIGDDCRGSDEAVCWAI